MKRILWADDEPWYLESLRVGLRAQGYLLECTETFGDTLRLLREARSNPYDLLIWDIMQPCETLEEQLAMDATQLREAAERAKWAGVEAYRAAKELVPDQRILIYSVVPESEIRRHAPDIDFDCLFIRKGGQRDDFLNAVEELLRE